MDSKATPIVSVIIPSYNHGRYLGRALRSVVNQTYKNWEAIVIDNNSTDNTDEVLAGFSYDSRIKCLKIDNEGIIAASRNAGIAVAKGEWIAFLDSDDWWVDEKLNECFCNINEHINVVYHDLDIVYEAPRMFKRTKTKSWQLKTPVVIDLLLNGNAIANSSVMVRKSLLVKVGCINESASLVALEDYNTWLKVAIETNAFKYIPKALGGYFVHSGGMSRKDLSLSYKEATFDFIDQLSARDLKRFNKNLDYINGRRLYLKKDYKKAEVDLKKSIECGNLRRCAKAFFMLALIRLRTLKF